MAPAEREPGDDVTGGEGRGGDDQDGHRSANHPICPAPALAVEAAVEPRHDGAECRLGRREHPTQPRQPGEYGIEQQRRQ